jgi:hypothetical protein
MDGLRLLRSRLWPGRNRHVLYWLTSDLAISARPDRDAWPEIAAARVRAALSLLDGDDEGGDCAELGLAHRVLPVPEGSAPSLAELWALTSWVLERTQDDGPVLIYCREGRGRSAMLACAVLMRLGYSPADAYLHLMRVRPEAVLSAAQTDALEHFARLLGPFSDIPNRA